MHLIRRIIVHHSASPRETTKLEDIDAWHRKRGFDMVGYHYVIEGNGDVKVGRQLNRRGAHCLQDGANFDSIGICLVGDNTKPGEEWSSKQRAALLWLIYSLREVFQKQFPVFGHRDIPGTSTLCPGRDIMSGYLGDHFADPTEQPLDK